MHASTHAQTHTNTGMCRLLYYLHMNANSYTCTLSDILCWKEGTVKRS